MNNSYDFPVTLQPIYLLDNQGKNSEILGRKAVVRTDTMQTLGLVSNDYGLVEHKTVVDSFREAGKAYNVKEKISVTHNGAFLFYEMTFPRVEYEVKKGDIVKMMMIAKNSYNGMNSLQVIFGAYRLVCSNGMILGTQFLSFMYRHTGNVGGLGDNSMLDQYKDAYTNYVKLFGERMPLISEMSRKTLSSDEGLFDKEKVALPQYLLEEAKQSYHMEQDKTVWGYYNALTFAVTHKLKQATPSLSIAHGVQAWKAAEAVLVN